MIKQLCKWKKFIILLAIPYFFFLFIFTYRIDYSLTTPGGLTLIEDQVVFDNQFDNQGSFYTIYVMAIDRPTFFQFGLAYFDKTIETMKLPESQRGISDEVNWRSGQIAKDNAWNAAIISSFIALGYEVEYDIQMQVTLIYDYISNKDLDLGDQIIAVNGNSNIFTEINAVSCNEAATFTVITVDGVTVEYDIIKQNIDGSCRFGLSVSQYYNLTYAEIPYEIKPTFTGGPSGGFMQFLHIYNVLTEEDITHGYKIAGTGTIRLDGTVGPIGGVTQKVITAHYAGVDILFVPRLNDNNYNDNYQVALRAMELIDTDMKLVGVETWLDAINYLINLGGDPDEL
ncbi:S16 family serine protease [Liberiplasma polymorphum]|uniref:S16 family serine protease n=1 Tax=Liberiplasma polymorphum TaxID=3374570 RepID=UPI003773C278